MSTLVKLVAAQTLPLLEKEVNAFTDAKVPNPPKVSSIQVNHQTFADTKTIFYATITYTK